MGELFAIGAWLGAGFAAGVLTFWVVLKAFDVALCWAMKRIDVYTSGRRR